MANKIKVRLVQKMDEVYSEKQRKYMCVMAKDGADRPKGLSQAEAEEMCGDTEHSKKNEAIIATKDGDKEVKASRGETEHFFVHKSGKRYIVTHKPSGKALPAVVTKYGTKLSDFQKVMKDLEDANIAGIGDENPSIETLRAIKDVLKKIDERCQKGYKTHATRKTKVMFGKRYRNCVKAEEQQVTKARNKKK
tara:strand:+ start:4941 stop:5519 length:579 start_codon:yes stop_codon:yes gene_type:complete